MGQATKGSAVRYTEEEVAGVTEAVIDLAELALTFGRIDRTGPQHPNGLPESDTDHTVMLGWIAPALADLINKKAGFARHSVGKVAQYALIHDAVEVYAGDTPTVRITEEELQDKEVREAEAAVRLIAQFRESLPWFASMVRRYELQQDMDARFVRAVDKLMPKLVHVVCAGRDLVRSGFSRADFEGVVKRQRKQVEEWCPDQLLLAIYDRVADWVKHHWPEDPPDPPAQPRSVHTLTVTPHLIRLHHRKCTHEYAFACPFTLAYEQAMRFNQWPKVVVEEPYGEYEVVLDERGELFHEES